MTSEVSLEFIRDKSAPAAQVFLRLGMEYMAEVAAGDDVDVSKFLNSILRRQGECDRWLALFILRGQPVGFAHFKIDRDERPGWGYVLEFYVVPEQRRRSVGTQGWLQMKAIFETARCLGIWLASHPAAEGFWKACGLRETGEHERGQKILIVDLNQCVTRRARKGAVQ